MLASELPQTFTVREAADFLGISKPTVDRRISSGMLMSYKDGKLRRIRREALIEYQNSLERVNRDLLAGDVGRR